MGSDSDWVEDVRRWCRPNTQPAGSQPAKVQHGADSDMAALGYEAAHPALQARHWPDAQNTGSEPLR